MPPVTFGLGAKTRDPRTDYQPNLPEADQQIGLGRSTEKGDRIGAKPIVLSEPEAARFARETGPKLERFAPQIDPEAPRPVRQPGPPVVDEPAKPAVLPNYTDQDWSDTIDTLIAESAGEGAEGMTGVAAVIRNRAQKAGKSIGDIVRAPRQFEGYENPRAGSRAAQRDPSIRAEAERIMRGVMSGELPDPTNGADHFKADYVNPAWASKMPETARIGGHTFYNSEGTKAPALDAIDKVAGEAQGKGAPLSPPDDPTPLSGAGGRLSFDNKGQDVGLKPAFTDLLTNASQDFGKDFRITSGFRSPQHPVEARKKNGGGEHTHGTASDISMAGLNDQERAELVSTLAARGARRFGVYGDSPNMLHVDMREMGDKRFGQEGMWFMNDRSAANLGSAPAWFQAYAQGERPAPRSASKGQAKETLKGGDVARDPIIVDANYFTPKTPPADAPLGEPNPDRFGSTATDSTGPLDPVGARAAELNEKEPGRYSVVPADQVDAWRQKWEGEQDGEFMKGLKGALVDQTPELTGNSLEVLGILTGSQAVRDLGKQAQDYGKQGAWKRAGRVQSVADISTDSFGAFIDDATSYAAYSLGKGIGSMAPNLITGGAAATVTANPIVGFVAGAAGPSYVQNLGDLFGAMKDNPGIQAKLKDGSLSEKQLATYAATGAIPMAALDAAGLSKVAGLVGKEAKDAIVKRVVKGAIEGSITEGLTEGAQQIISEATQDLAGGDRSFRDQAVAVVDNFIGGALTGGAVGAGGGATPARTPAAPPTNAPAVKPKGMLGRAADNAFGGDGSGTAPTEVDPLASGPQRRFKISDPAFGDQPAGAYDGLEGTVVEEGANQARIRLDDGRVVQLGKKFLQEVEAKPEAAASSTATGEAPAREPRARKARQIVPDGAPAPGTTVEMDAGDGPFMGTIQHYEDGEAQVMDSSTGELLSVPPEQLKVLSTPNVEATPGEIVAAEKAPSVAAEPVPAEAVAPVATAEAATPAPVDATLTPETSTDAAKIAPETGPTAIEKAETSTAAAETVPPVDENDPALKPVIPTVEDVVSELPPEAEDRPAFEDGRRGPKRGESVIVKGAGGRFPAKLERFEEGGDEVLVKDAQGRELQVTAGDLFVNGKSKADVEAEALEAQPPVAREVAEGDKATARKVRNRNIVLPDDLHARLFDLGRERETSVKLAGGGALDRDRVQPAVQSKLATEFGVSERAVGQMADAYRTQVDQAAIRARSMTPIKMGGYDSATLKQAQADNSGQVTYKTAKGSTYYVEDDGTTTRNKKFRPEHGEAEQGMQARSQQTFYVTPEEANKLGEIQARGAGRRAVAAYSDGRMGVKFLEGDNAGKFEGRTMVQPKTEPEIGLIPVELWKDGTRVHFGNEITEVNRPSNPTAKISVSSAEAAVDAAAREAAMSDTNDRPEPTQAQKDAGNYAKGHVRLGGLDLSIENPAGSTRSGTSRSGKPWSVQMKSHYGYIRGTEGKDGDQIDAFVKPGTAELADDAPVFVVDQIDPSKGRRALDEHKVMLGYGSEQEAKKAYAENYTKAWKGMGAITPTTLGGFKRWLREGNTKKPFAKAATNIQEQFEPAATVDKPGVISAPVAPAPSAPAPKFPEHVSVGPFGFKPSPLKAGRLFRETDAEGVYSALSDNMQGAPLGTTFATDDRDLALGQGANRGAVITFKDGWTSGRAHQKPGTGIVGGREYVLDYMAPSAIERIELTPAAAKRLRKGAGMIARRSGLAMTRQADGGVVFEAPQSKQGQNAEDAETAEMQASTPHDAAEIKSSTTTADNTDVEATSAKSGEDAASGDQSIQRSEGADFSKPSSDDDAAPSSVQLVEESDGTVTQPRDSRQFSKAPDSGTRRFGLPERGLKVIAPFSEMESITSHPSYREAKAGNRVAAGKLVSDLVDDELIAKARVAFPADAIFVAPRAIEAKGANAIPTAFSHILGDALDAQVEDRLVQSNRAFHTGARPLDRLLGRPVFDGPVIAGGKYVLVDDVNVLGGTLAELANHIRSNDGEVVGVATLVNRSRSGIRGASRKQVQAIEERYGDIVREKFGIDPVALTGDEALVILGARDADALRNRVATAEIDRGRRLLQETVQRPQEETAEGGLAGTEGAPAGTSGDSTTTEPSVQPTAGADAEVKRKGDEFKRSPDARALPATRLSPAEMAELAQIVRDTAGIDPQWEGEIRIPAGNPDWANTEDVKATGYYSPGEVAALDAIVLALDGADRFTARHEAFHRAQQRWLTPEEAAVLKAELPRLRRIVAGALRNPGEAYKMSRSEVEAEAYAIYSEGKARQRPQKLLRAGWDRITRIVRRVGNWLSGRGLKTAEDVFDETASGEMRNRAPREAATRKDYSAQLARKTIPGPVASPVSREAIIDSLKGKWVDWQKPLLATVPLNWFPDLAQPNMTAVRDYMRVRGRLDAYRGKVHEEMDAIAQRWLKYARLGKDKVAALSGLMHDATLAGVDPALTDEESQAHPSYAALRQTFLKLPPAGRKLFEDVRDAYRKSADELDAILLDNVRKATDIAHKQAETEHKAALERIGKARMSKADRDLAIDKENQAHAARMWRAKASAKARLTKLRIAFESSRVEGYYAPLARFGDYFVTVRDVDGQVLSFSKRETEAERNRLAKEMRKAYPTAEIKTGVMAERTSARDAMDPRLLAELDKIIGGLGIPEAAATEILDRMNQRYLETMPDLSTRKRFIHRKGTAGFDGDALRAFSSNMFHAGHQHARLKYGMELQELVNDVMDQGSEAPDPVRGGMLANELKKRDEWVRNPEGSSFAQAVTSTMFVWYLAATPAAAIVNLTQPIMLGIPTMGSKYGFAKATAALGKAARDLVSTSSPLANPRLSHDEKLMLQNLEDGGVIDRSMSYSLAGVGDTGVRYSPQREKLMKTISWPFHIAEVANRTATALTAYRLAKAGGANFTAATETASDMVYRVNFDVSNSARPRFMQGDWQKVALVFQSFQLNNWYLIARNTHQAFAAATPAKKAEARKMLAGMAGMMTLMGGVTGFFGYNVMMAIAGMFLGDDDDPFSFADQMDRHIVDLFGPDLGSAILKGVPTALTGLDISSRVGMPDLFIRAPDTRAEGGDLAKAWIAGAGGVVASTVINMFDSISLAADGKVARAVEVSAPKLIKDMMQAYRYANEGILSRKGDPVIERDQVRAWDWIAEVMGFTSAHVAERYERNAALKNAEQNVLDRRRELMNQYALARMMGDEEARRRVFEKIKRFNAVPINKPLRITPKTLTQSMKTRTRNAAKRQDGVLIQNEKLGRGLREMMPEAAFQ